MKNFLFLSKFSAILCPNVFLPIIEKIIIIQKIMPIIISNIKTKADSFGKNSQTVSERTKIKNEKQGNHLDQAVEMGNIGSNNYATWIT